MVERQPSISPLAFDECVGYEVPLFLGGGDEIDNLQVADMEVYWTLTGQLRVATHDLRPGRSVSEIGM
ncbi:T6SS immunity protein Tdi1 domain-containing protein [Leifsonia poae]|uniref:T6SS immunity protein Tdi1 domain-containing protein n=1 Tax=Leifsonia poae TaxID=110933 RepID=UPI003D668F38